MLGLSGSGLSVQGLSLSLLFLRLRARVSRKKFKASDSTGLRLEAPGNQLWEVCKPATLNLEADAQNSHIYIYICMCV